MAYQYPHITYTRGDFNCHGYGIAKGPEHGLLNVRGKYEELIFKLLKKNFKDVFHNYALYSMYGVSHQLDFVLTDHETYLINIEVDEFYHWRKGFHPSHLVDDNQYRDIQIADNGMTVIRFTERQLICFTDTCISILKDIKENRIRKDKIWDTSKYHKYFFEDGWSEREANDLISMNYRNHFSFEPGYSKKYYFFYKWSYINTDRRNPIMANENTISSLNEDSNYCFMEDIRHAIYCTSNTQECIELAFVTIGWLNHRVLVPYYFILMNEEIKEKIRSKCIILPSNRIVHNLFFKLKDEVYFKVIDEDTVFVNQ